MHIDVKVIATTTCIFANESLLVGFINSLLQLVGFVPELPSDIDVASFSFHAEAYNESSLDQFVRVVSQDFSILAGARFRLISIDNKVGGSILQ